MIRPFKVVVMHMKHKVSKGLNALDNDRVQLPPWSGDKLEYILVRTGKGRGLGY